MGQISCLGSEKIPNFWALTIPFIHVAAWGRIISEGYQNSFGLLEWAGLSIVRDYTEKMTLLPQQNVLLI